MSQVRKSWYSIGSKISKKLIFWNVFNQTKNENTNSYNGNRRISPKWVSKDSCAESPRKIPKFWTSAFSSTSALCCLHFHLHLCLQFFFWLTQAPPIFKILDSDSEFECFYNQIRYVWPEATSKYWDRDWIWTSERRLLIG